MTEKEKTLAFSVICDFAETTNRQLLTEKDGFSFVSMLDGSVSSKFTDLFELISSTGVSDDIREALEARIGTEKIGTDESDVLRYIVLESPFFESALGTVAPEWVQNLTEAQTEEIDELVKEGEALKYFADREIVAKVLSRRDYRYADLGDTVYTYFDPGHRFENDEEFAASEFISDDTPRLGVSKYSSWSDVISENIAVLDYEVNNSGVNCGFTPAELHYMARPLVERRYKVFSSPKNDSKVAIYDDKKKSFLLDTSGNYIEDSDMRRLFDKAKKLNADWLSWI